MRGSKKGESGEGSMDLDGQIVLTMSKCTRCGSKKKKKKILINLSFFFLRIYTNRGNVSSEVVFGCLNFG